MQIVIDIPEDVIEGAKSSPNYYPTYHFEKIWRAIVNGTPLPKGHGIEAKEHLPSVTPAQSVIEDIRAEIEAKAKEREIYLDAGHPHNGLYEALKIIDKYIAKENE